MRIPCCQQTRCLVEAIQFVTSLPVHFPALALDISLLAALRDLLVDLRDLSPVSLRQLLALAQRRTLRSTGHRSSAGTELDHSRVCSPCSERGSAPHFCWPLLDQPLAAAYKSPNLPYLAKHFSVAPAAAYKSQNHPYLPIQFVVAV